jgi:hypothetical protein
MAMKRTQETRKATPKNESPMCVKQDLLLASGKQIFELPIHVRMLLHSRKLETWVRLVTPTVKRALADAEQPLFDTNHTIMDLIAPARPDSAPRMQRWIKHTQQIFLCLFDSLRLWLTPIVRMPLTGVCLRCRSSARVGDD